MKLDNSKTIIGSRIKLFVVSILFIVYIILTYAAKYFKPNLFGWSHDMWTIIFVGIWIFIMFLPIWLNHQYISYSDDDELIVFRYFTSGLFGGGKNSIEIDKRTFAGYKTEKQLLGLSLSITLYQNTKKGIAQYPPIYITALNKKERVKVFRSLNQYSPKS
jgi:hypothetical protein